MHTAFDKDWKGLEISYQKHKEAYSKIFQRCGLKFVVVEASSGLMGGKKSEEFMVITETGEDAIAVCESCGYHANVEVAKAKLPVEQENGAI
uniref:Proline--tRNA ligase n=1 Tax=candidate division WOR-3 bacterium TaxID=2052148 RepID=A0A7C2K3R4_UNCW3